ncbi:hypothetical protein [Fluviicola chungangensis]|uniref:Lipocalin-like domain-containing protein n=1 Tax=Fluviicola chungangensis TaxID=2597671 RepID=A0A556N7B4_9FLAO|nr:hypothetical protein [Fluviicola chungangensis]TSJ48018.1 hypothetical protein FO442_02490 [Fluviicola chungangensis]
MKHAFVILFSMLFLLGCSKEKQTYRSLKGEWDVLMESTHWYNGSNSSPSYTKKDHYATVEFDKKGKGKMVVPGGVDYYNGFAYPYEEETYILEAGTELIHFYSESDPTASDDLKLTWKWDKKSFVLSNGDIHYNNNSSYYSEVKFTCTKKK